MAFRAFRLLALIGVLASAGDVLAANAWTKLRLGMTAGDTMTTVGQPLMRSGKLGLEVWIYDNQAEVVLCGSVVGWTCPSENHQPGASVDIWRNGGDGASGATLLAPGARAPATPQAPARETAVGRAPGFRYRR